MQIGRTFNVLGVALNFALAVGLYATAKSPLPIWLTVVLAIALLAAPIWLAFQARNRSKRNIGLVLVCLGTALVWAPLYLTAYVYTGPAPALISKATDISIAIGIVVLIVSVFWRAPNQESV
jgi:FtsH-binding integral membrane protein